MVKFSQKFLFWFSVNYCFVLQYNYLPRVTGNKAGQFSKEAFQDALIKLQSTGGN